MVTQDDHGYQNHDDEGDPKLYHQGCDDDRQESDQDEIRLAYIWDQNIQRSVKLKCLPDQDFDIISYR